MTGHDNEGPLYSGTIFLNGKQYDIRTESDRAELTADIPEGISSLKYYVTDLAGNRSEIIGKSSYLFSKRRGAKSPSFFIGW